LIICVRNESKNIARCLDSILQQQYPENKLEIIVVDDHSTDNTVSIIEKHYFNRVNLIRLADHEIPAEIKAFKKFGIQLAVERASGDIMVTSDADCVYNKDWLSTLTAPFLDPKIDVVVGPVLISEDDSLLTAFQQYDLGATFAVTAFGIEHGSFYSGAGANLAYRRNIFLECLPYASNFHIPSGDDIFLLENMVHHPQEIAFAFDKPGAVLTSPERTIMAFLRQRMRWAGKSRHYSSQALNMVWLMAMAMNIVLLASTIYSLYHLSGFLISLCTLVWICKIVVDRRLIMTVLDRYGPVFSNTHFLLNSFLFPLYLMVIVTLVALPIPTSWKGRQL
jgi:glycosyltransferase involved in cell wall biosynthesis